MRLKNRPFLSVIMSVHNGEAFLREAIESVLSQSYKDFEFIIVDDGSSDNSVKIIESFDDSRILLLKNKTNLKLPASLNRALTYARGEYILRMDADDVCLPGRFYKQVCFMEKHKEIDVASTRTFSLDEDGVHFVFDTHPNSAALTRCTLLFFNILIHPSTIARKKVFEEFQYDPKYSVAQDLDLWIRMSEKFSIARMSSTTLLYRSHKMQTTQMKRQQQLENEMYIKMPMLFRLFGEVTDDMQMTHAKVSSVDGSLPNSEVVDWLLKLKSANEKKNIYPIKEFEEVLIRIGFTNGIRSGNSWQMMGLLIYNFGILKVFQVISLIMAAFAREGVRFFTVFTVKAGY